jgi:hypothetical protein
MGFNIGGYVISFRRSRRMEMRTIVTTTGRTECSLYIERVGEERKTDRQE